MTDEIGIPEPVTDPASAPRPMPLPLEQQSVGPRKRKVWPWVVGGAILLVLIGGCVASVWLLDNAGNSITETLSGGGVFGQESVSWSGNGRFGVVQYYRDYIYPSVAVWDKTTGECQTIDGYRVLFVEPNAPVAWLEPLTDEQAETAKSEDSMGDQFDHKPDRLVAWRLDDGSKPTDDVGAKWGAWSGPGESIAYLEINPLKGAGPSALLFNNKASHGEGVKAKIPATINTFVPVGWSASGRYFAVQQLIPTVAYDSESAGEDVPPQLVVFDALTGEMTGDFVVANAAMRAPIAAWDGTEDRLFWIESESPDADGPVVDRLWTAEATGAQAEDAFKAMDWEQPSGFGDAYDVSMLGWDPSGPLFGADRRIWQVTPDGFKNLGMTDSVGGSWYPGSGLLTIEWTYGSGPVDQEWAELFLYDQHGGSRESVWRGPKSDVPTD